MTRSESPGKHGVVPSGTTPHRVVSRWIEFLVLFGVIPTLFLLPLGRAVTASIVLGGLAYVVVVSVKAKVISRHAFGLNGFRAWFGVLARVVVFALVTTFAVWRLAPDELFTIVRRAPRLWITMSVVYCVFSVYPQGLLFRGFFFSRYDDLFPDSTALIVAGAVVFSYAHTLIAHPLVFVLTFFGGLLFGLTYRRSGSLLVVAIEHALYGLWLFTVGLGGIFAFPGV